MKKRFSSALLLLVLVTSLLFVPLETFAAYTGETVLHTRLVRPVTINEVDLLMERQAEALLRKDTALYEEIDRELEQRGVKEVSLNEVIALTGSVPAFDGYATNAAAASSATFRTVYSAYITGGKSYDVMRVYATPTGSTGTLYQTGVTAVKNTASATAIGMQFAKIAVSTVAGIASDTIGTIQSVYDALKGMISVLSPTATITDIQTSYTWSAAETCVFVYFKSPTIPEMWNLKGQYSKATASVATATPVLKVSGSSVIANTITRVYNGSATPANYDSTLKAFQAYTEGGTYVSAISKITVTGIQGKTVKTINLANPEIPALID